jgi:hypothetical protein
MTTPPRRPVSTRHAFALAFDLALRRDPLHSLVVPLLLRAPWIVAMTLLPTPTAEDSPGGRTLIWALAALGDALASLIVTAMLRVRARAVFRSAPGSPRPPALECYAQGLARVPWLFVTEFLRSLAIALGLVLFVVPGVYVAYRLAFATEAVVLDDRNAGAAFPHSIRLTSRRFVRWFELVAGSTALVLAGWFALAVLMVVVRRFSIDTWSSLAYLAAIAVWPVFQYAWTFFYLRLVEVEETEVHEVGPLYAATGAETPAPVAPIPPRPEPHPESGPIA